MVLWAVVVKKEPIKFQEENSKNSQEKGREPPRHKPSLGASARSPFVREGPSFAMAKKKKKKGGAGGGKNKVVKASSDTEDYSDSEDEGRSSYRKGGYHPVKVGDVYNGRYLVHRKLGWGHFSTVWLATDKYAKEKSPHRCVALKIQKSAPQYSEAAEDEIELLKAIRAHKGKGAQCSVLLLDSFRISGPNGKHYCMVFEVMGRNLLSLIKRYNYRGVPLEVCRRIAYQMLIGLDFLHRECKIIHTDIKPENILMSVDVEIDAAALETAHRARESRVLEEMKRQLHEMDPEGKMSKTKRRKMKKEIRRRVEKQFAATPGASGEGKAGKKRKAGAHRAEDCYDIKISDLGNGCWVHKHFTDDITTRQYRSPEVIVGIPYSCPTDVWSVACMVFELVTGDYLFDPKADKHGRHDRDEDHLALIMELLGRMPKRMCQQGKFSRQYFDRRGELRKIKNLDFWGLESILTQKYKLSSKDAKALSGFLTPMLALDPAMRISAGDAAKDPWLAPAARELQRGEGVGAGPTDSKTVPARPKEDETTNATNDMKRGQDESLEPNESKVEQSPTRPAKNDLKGGQDESLEPNESNEGDDNTTKPAPDAEVVGQADTKQVEDKSDVCAVSPATMASATQARDVDAGEATQSGIVEAATTDEHDYNPKETPALLSESITGMDLPLASESETPLVSAPESTGSELGGETLAAGELESDSAKSGGGTESVSPIVPVGPATCPLVKPTVERGYTV